ncbi:hypothetical protein [Cloacibacterium normanense]|uniref:hypothetical protein n=1 Tax=Cloacibacterium normanense TaxID=237258 RepID=UPI00391ADADA
MNSKEKNLAGITLKFKKIMKKHFIIIPTLLLSIALVSCRTSEEIESENYNSTLKPNSRIEISNTVENDSINIQSFESSEEKKDPPVKDRQDWRKSN